MPTAHCHVPCRVGYTRFLWPVWPFTIHYLQNRDRRRELAERMLSGEDLQGGYVSQTVGHAALKTIIGRPGTNLYHHHGESEDIGRSCIFITCLQDLRCGPPRSVSLHRSYEYGVELTSNRSEAEIRQTGVATVVDENIWLIGCYQCSSMQPRAGTCPF